MSNVSVITICFKDDLEKEYISIDANNDEIIMNCIQAAKVGKPIYSIYREFQGCQIVRRDPKTNRHYYVSNYRNGEFTWVRDYAYGKHFSLATATKHIATLYKED